MGKIIYLIVTSCFPVTGPCRDSATPLFNITVQACNNGAMQVMADPKNYPTYTRGGYEIKRWHCEEEK